MLLRWSIRGQGVGLLLAEPENEKSPWTSEVVPCWAVWYVVAHCTSFVPVVVSGH